MVAQACNPSTEETEAGQSHFPGQLGLHSETLCQNKTRTMKRQGMVAHTFNPAAGRKKQPDVCESEC